MTGYPNIDRPWLKYYKKQPSEIEYPKTTLFQFAWDNSKNNLEDIVFNYCNNKISYKSFFDNVEKAAKAFISLGIKEGDVVTIMSMHTPETLYSIYGLNYIGATSNLVYMTLSDQELIDSINNTESKLLLILDVMADKIEEINKYIDIPIVLLNVDESLPSFIKSVYRIKNIRKISRHKTYMLYKNFILQGKNTVLSNPATNHLSTAVIVYTSGTTGQQKGVCLSNYNMNALATQDYNGVMNFERGKSCLMILPPFIGFGITQIHIMVSAGITSILQIDLEPEKIIKELFRHKPYVFLTGPALADAFLSHKKSDLSGVKYFIGGGGAITSAQTESINKMLKECNSSASYSNGYGMTEASSLLCASANELSKDGSVGIPFIDTNIKIINVDTNKECTYGEVGELWFSTPTLMSGYLNNTDETDEIIVRDENGTAWLRTGDLGIVDKDGFVFLKGRLKRIFITMGRDNNAYKLFPQLIEETMKEMDIISDCGVITKPDQERMNIAIAFVSLKDETIDSDGNEKYINRIQEFAQDRLPEHMIPHHIHILKRIPVLPSGKIDYKTLESLQE